jgi:hypothetical protein
VASAVAVAVAGRPRRVVRVASAVVVEVGAEAVAHATGAQVASEVAAVPA